MNNCVVFSTTALEKSCQVISDIVQFYFPVYNLPKSIYLDNLFIFHLTEATIYQVDSLHENSCTENISAYWQNWRNVLTAKDLWDSNFEIEIENSKKFYQLEKKLQQGQVLNEQEVHQAILFRSYDLQILHRLFLLLAGIPPKTILLQYARLREAIVEIEEDLKHYQQDIKDNHFNTFRAYVRLFQEKSTSLIQDKLLELETSSQELLCKIEQPYQNRLDKVKRDYRSAYPTPTVPEPVIE